MITTESPATVLPIASNSQVRHWLTTALLQRRIALMSVVLVGFLAAAATTAPIYLLGTLVDRVHSGDSVTSLVTLAIVIAGSALLGGLGTGMSSYLIAYLGGYTVAELREHVMQHVLNTPATTIEDSGRGDVLSRVSADVAAAAKAVTQVLPTTFNALFLGIATLIGMTSLDWRLGLAGALCIPAYIIGLRWYLPRSAPMYANERRAVAVSTQRIVESIQGVKTLHAYEIYKNHADEITRCSASVRKSSVAAFTVFTRLVGRVNRAEFIGLTATLITGFFLVRSGDITVGAVTAAALLFHRLFNPLGMMMYNFDEIQKASVSLARLIGIIDVVPAAVDARVSLQQSPTVLTSTTDIAIEEVSFCYGSESDCRPEVLSDITLHIPSGTRCAIVGATGAGKSTLAGIIAGVYKPTRGNIRIGGVTISDFSPDQLRNTVAMISQENHVFSGPLIDDLRLVAPQADRDAIWTALHTVGAADWVAALDNGLDTLVGETHAHISAFHAQHIALARLVLADPAVVVLDEATAEAGSSHACELEAAVIAATAGRTTIIVAHRLTQAATADYIAVMDKGRIVESGTHSELIMSSGRYAQLWQAWSLYR